MRLMHFRIFRCFGFKSDMCIFIRAPTLVPNYIGFLDLRAFRHQLQKLAPSGTNYKLSSYAPGRRFIYFQQNASVIAKNVRTRRISI